MEKRRERERKKKKKIKRNREKVHSKYKAINKSISTSGEYKVL